MNVSHLQQHLLDLGKLLDASGAGKPVVADLQAIGERLSPFRDLSLKAFADFLDAAREAVRKGEALPPPGTKAGTRGASKPKAPAADVGVLARIVGELYERAASPEVTEERIGEVLAQLDGLKKDDLAVVATGMRIPLKKSESKAGIIKTIRFWITDRRGKSLRSVLGSVAP